MTVPFVVVLAMASAPSPFTLFMFNDKCVVLDSDARIVERLDLTAIGLERPTDADVSPDGKHVLVTAWSADSQNTGLFEVEVATKLVRQRGEKVGFHAAPSYTRDGKWIQFAHHATLGGPVGMHELRQYAQLYRELSDGSQPPVQLTSSDGCHMESSSRTGASIYFAHADCRGGRRIELLSEGKERVITNFDSHLGEPSLSDDGRTIVASRVVGDTLEIVEFHPTTPAKIETLWRGTRFRDQFRPRYLSNGDVIFQNGPAIIRLQRTQKTITAVELWSFQ